MERAEAVDSSTKVFLKECIGVVGFAANAVGIFYTPRDAILRALAEGLAIGMYSVSLTERAFPALRGNRQVFAVNPYEPYHILHCLNFAVNAIALCYLATSVTTPVIALLTLNVLLSRPVLHWGNSAIGYLMQSTAPVKA